MVKVARPVKVVNPTRNPGELFVLGKLAGINPQRSRMAKTKKNYRKAAAKNPRRNRRNPWFVAKTKHKKNYTPRHRRRNPTLESELKMPADALKFGLIALLGLVGTRQIPQLLLADKNQGWWGYAANLATAVAGGMATSKFAGQPAGVAVMTGGGLYLVNRILTEKLAPVGSYLSLAGVGDAAAAPTVGRLRTAYFPFPVVRDRQGNPVIPAEIDAQSLRAQIAAAAQSQAQAKPATMAGVSRPMTGKFAAA